MLLMLKHAIREYWRELLLAQIVATCAYALLWTDW